MVERLLKDLAPLDERLWLVIDDVHELGSDEARRQLELLLMRAPEELRFVLATRYDVRLGLHRLRLEGELTEVRADDLRFSLAEARELMAAAGVQLTDPALALLVDRPEEVRRLLLRTSVLEQVNGELADLLTRGSGGERVLQDLEQAGAFVVSLDPARSWFRYHRLFADLLQLELRRTEPGEVSGLHELAATWFAGHGFPVDAIRHAQAAQDWGRAARLLADHWPGLYLDGQAATVHKLLAGFPAEARAADADLAALAAADELAQGSLEAAERYLGLAERGLEAVFGSAPASAGRRGQALVLLGVVRLLLAGQRGNLLAVAEEAQRLQILAEAPEAAQYDLAPAARAGLSDELRALALIILGDTEIWAARLDQAEPHLEQAAALARRIGRPYLEFIALAHQSAGEVTRSLPRAAELSRRAIDLAERHGWTDETAAGIAYMALGSVLAWQGRLGEAEAWLQRAEGTVRAEADPAVALAVHHIRAQLELARGREADALAAFRAAERLARHLAAPSALATPMRALLLLALVRLGETERAEQILDGLSEDDRDRGEIGVAAAMLRLAQDDPHAATVALAPVLDESAPVGWRSWLVEAFLLEAIARDALGDHAAAGRALERAFDLAEPEGALLWFLLHPAPGLLERHARQGTAHSALIAEILDLQAGKTPAPQAGPRPPLKPLSGSEIRVLRYLPTHLSAPEIAGELSLSTSTVKTHLRNLYAKLGVHSRAEAVESARTLGLLAPSAHSRLLSVLSRTPTESPRTHWIRGFTALERTGSGVSWRSQGPAHTNRDADGAGVTESGFWNVPPGPSP
jgi:LuxR family transcriptional regulator, maltose regulon positive regulatory protein